MKSKLLAVMLAIALLASPTQSYAWGHQGHAIVAQVAFQYMTAANRAKLMALLDGMTVEEAANWMDAIKSDHANDYMKPYHYLNIEKGGKEMPKEDNMVSVLQKTIKDLDGINTLSKEEVKLKVLFLMHLIGDLHQPLHVGYGSDKGGNTVQLSFFGRGSNLHAVWDTDIIEYKGINTAGVFKTNTYTPEQLAAVRKIDVIGWAAQSRGHLKEAYRLPSNKIGDLYADANKPVIEAQLLNAGIRLAAVLDYYLGSYEGKP
ncbi:MAG TPA: S1/P1 nuclease [Ferruginibacter sp.]|nr:S1/P1 nuclease [Ferruginibacter sp.]